MEYDTIIVLPHHMLGGKLNFLDEPELGELIELIPLATFKVVEISQEKRKIRLSFKEIYHCVDVIGIATTQMSFDVIDFSNMTRYL
jgi:hypothetical protein